MTLPSSRDIHRQAALYDLWRALAKVTDAYEAAEAVVLRTLAAVLKAKENP